MSTRSSARAKNVQATAGAIRLLRASAALLAMLGLLIIVPVVPAMRAETDVIRDAGAPVPLPSNLRQAGGDASWWHTITADLARRECEVTATPTGDLQAPNRSQNLRATFGAGGIEVVPRTDKNVTPAWRFAWETRGIGRNGEIETAGPAIPEAAGSRVTYSRNGWSEWYENTTRGIEQGFTLSRRPGGTAGETWSARSPTPAKSTGSPWACTSPGTIGIFPATRSTRRRATSGPTVRRTRRPSLRRSCRWRPGARRSRRPSARWRRR